MGAPIYGELELATKLLRRKVLPRTRDATGRYCGVRAGSRLELVDLGAPELPVVATFARAGENARASPDGRRIVVRWLGKLELRDETRTLASIRTPTVELDWRGQRLDPLAPTQQPLADEHFGITHDGKYVWLASHDESGRPCLFLYDDALTLLDTFTDLRAYSPYVKAPYEPLRCWSESWLRPQPHAPGWIVGGVNGGDSCLAVVAFRTDGGRLTVEQEAISKSVFGVDAHFLRDLRVTPAGELLLMTSDSIFVVLPWPPSPAAPRLSRVDPVRSLIRTRRDIVLPFRHPPDLTVIGCVDATHEHVLCGIESGDGRTAAIVALHPVSFEPLGVVRTPRVLLELLGRDLFSAAGSVWRLVR